MSEILLIKEGAPGKYNLEMNNEPSSEQRNGSFLPYPRSDLFVFFATTICNRQMSKKSTDRCCDSDTDTKSTTTYGRNCGSNSTQSTLSSTKDVSGSLPWPTGDHDCSSCSSTYSCCSTPYRNNLLVADQEERKNISMYLDRLRMYRKELKLHELHESTPKVKVNTSSSASSQTRRPISAPVFAIKRLSANSCKLQSIDENEEQDCKSNSTSAVSSQKCLNVQLPKWDPNRQYEQNVKITPRCIEVPPKKLCVRKKTPEVVNHTTGISVEKKCQIGTSWKVNGNKRFSLGGRDFILRKVNKDNIACVSTQTKRMLGVQTGCDYKHYDNKLRTESIITDVNSDSVKDEDTLSVSVNLPQSVEELASQPVALEPNIIIIETDEEKRRKRRHKKKRSGAIGDMSSDSGKSKENESEKDDSKNVLIDIIKAPTEDYFERVVSSRSYTPTYVVSTIYSDTTLQSNTKKSDLASSSEATPRYYSNTEIIEREIKTIDRESLSVVKTNIELSDTDEVIDVRSYKSMLADYSSGIQPTKSFPIHFDDLEKLEDKDEDTAAVTFKQKASECLQFAKSRLQDISSQLDQSQNSIEMERRSQASKNGSIIDMRKNQQTNLNYYLVGSSSESSITSEIEEKPSSPGIKYKEIQWEREEESHCCSCFASLRLL